MLPAWLQQINPAGGTDTLRNMGLEKFSEISLIAEICFLRFVLRSFLGSQRSSEMMIEDS